MKSYKSFTAALLLSAISTIGSANMASRIPADALSSAPDVSSTDLEATQGRGRLDRELYNIVNKLVDLYGFVGWQYGRLEALNRLGVEIGPYPGKRKVTKEWFKKHF